MNAHTFETTVNTFGDITGFYLDAYLDGSVEFSVMINEFEDITVSDFIVDLMEDEQDRLDLISALDRFISFQCQTDDEVDLMEW